jgi:hypothetical protein
MVVSTFKWNFFEISRRAESFRRLPFPSRGAVRQ